MKPRLRQQKTEANQPRCPEHAVPTPVLRTIDSGRMAEEDARRGAQLYSRLVNSLDCVVWEADARTFQFTFVSPQVKRMLGYALEEWLAPGFWAQHVHPEDVEWCTKLCMQATEEGRGHEFEYRMIAADGRTVWLRDVVTVQMAPDGPKRLTGVMIDVTSRKLAEAARQESEEQLRLVFEKSAAGIVIGDTTGRIIRANQRFCELVGFSQDELQGRRVLEITHPADREATQAYLEEAKSGRTSICKLEKRYVRPDGQVVWGRISAVFVFPDTHAPYSICVVQDITERKRAESLVALQKETLEMVAQGMPLKETLTTLVRQIELGAGTLGSIVLLDGDGLHVRHGAAPSLPEAYVKAIDGAPIGPRAGSCGTAMYRREPVVVIDVMQDPLWEDYRDLAAAHGVRACWSTPILSTDKRVLGSFAMYYPEPRGPSPVEMRLVEVATQLASIAIERQRTEELRRESEERFRTIFENAGLGTSLVDRHGHPVKCNPAVQKMLGYTEAELRNMAFTEFTHPDDIDLDWKLYSELVAGKRDRYEVDKRYIKKNGELMWGHLTVSLIKNRDGEPAEYTVGMVEDITERKRAEEERKKVEVALRESEAHFRILVEQASDGIAIAGADGRWIDVNSAWEAMVGYTREEILQQRVGANLPEEEKPRLAPLLARLRGGATIRTESTVRRKDGMLFPVEFIAKRLPDGRFQVIARDITERKRAEELLRESEERFRTIFVNAGVGAALVDWEGRPIKCNPALQRMLGYTEGELCNMVFTEFTYHDDIDLDWNLYRELVAGKRDKYEIEKRYVTKDGRLMWGQLTVSQVKNQDGTLAKYMVGLVADITDRKRAEEQLRQSEERYRSLVEATSEVVWTAQAGGEAVEVASWCEFTGQSPQEARDNWLAAVHPDDREETNAVWSNFLKSGSVYEREYRLRRRDGEYRLLSVRGVPVREKDGRIRELIGTFKDITEQKRAEMDLRVAHDRLTRELAKRTRAEAEIARLNERLINAQEEERTRIARELHDHLSQQIAVLGIALSNIKRQIPANRREAREQAERAYEKLLTIGEGIRHLSHQLHPAILEHSGMVAALESYCAEFESLTKVSATVQADGRFDDLPANTQLGIYRIAQEALHNIWKHAGVSEAGMCLVRAGERLQMRISDRGIGFDPARPSKEAGLGLVCMRERARLLGGTFSVESFAGEGTTIIADIPVNPASYTDVPGTLAN